jgi:acetylornithine deacetylase/succinyl-diaminopimelate desuccinylase-like protein
MTAEKRPLRLAFGRPSTATRRSTCSVARSGMTASPATRRMSPPISLRRCARSNLSAVHDGRLPARAAECLGRARRRRRRGPHLLFIGHTDVVHVDGWRENWAGTEREDPFGAAIVDGADVGPRRGRPQGRHHVVARRPVALSMRQGIQLAGDVSFAFVGDEESGQPGTGVSAGIKDYVARGWKPGRSSGPISSSMSSRRSLPSIPAQIGFFIADITITGRSAYFGVPELGKDALRASHACR